MKITYKEQEESFDIDSFLELDVEDMMYVLGELDGFNLNIDIQDFLFKLCIKISQQQQEIEYLQRELLDYLEAEDEGIPITIGEEIKVFVNTLKGYDVASINVEVKDLFGMTYKMEG